MRPESMPIRIRTLPGPPDPPTGSGSRAAEASLPGVSVPYFVSGTTLWLGSGPAGARLSLDAEESAIELWGQRSSSSELFLPFFFALAEAVRATGLLPLHAAVAVRGREAIAFLAASGTGKSTTLLRAVRSGWQPLCEDFCWLDPTDLRVYGWDRGVHLWPETLRQLVPELSCAPWKPAADGKLFLPYREITSRPPRSAELTRLAVLRRDPASDSCWRPLPPHEAIRALWEGVGVPLSAAARERAGSEIPRVLERLQVAELVLGSTRLPL